MERSLSFQDERKPQIVFYDIELDDAGLNPYEFRAYQRIARRCAGLQEGECFESLQAIADACKMSRPTLIRAIKVLLQRKMIRRISRHGGTSFYALTDKQNWLSFEQWEQAYKPEPGKPQNQGVVNHRTRGGKPQNQGVVHTFTHKNTHEEDKKENKRERAHSPVSSVPAIWQEVFGEPITIHAQEILESAVSDLDAFRRTLEIWKMNGYSRRSLDKILDRYNREAENNQTKQSVSANHLRLVDQMPDGLDDFGKTRWLKEQLAKGAAA